MTNEELMSVVVGGKVRVLKSGKIYQCRSATRIGVSGMLQPTFQQIRANSKGVVGLYGPAFVRFKPENIETVQS